MSILLLLDNAIRLGIISHACIIHQHHISRRYKPQWLTQLSDPKIQDTKSIHDPEIQLKVP